MGAARASPGVYEFRQRGRRAAGLSHFVFIPLPFVHIKVNTLGLMRPRQPRQWATSSPSPHATPCPVGAPHGARLDASQDRYTQARGGVHCTACTARADGTRVRPGSNEEGGV